ncbi:HEPN domain-containing protein [Paenibacillus sp. FSL R5-0341]|uniref:HEPN domain-containing protein n=1 Tax=Paenibacillus sp. FSL R5-0341 TaxID=2921636 RepID=UPI0030CB7BA8
MIKSLALFQSIIEDTRNTNALYNYLENVIKPPYDYSDLLRWQWAQSVSALDKLIHDLVRVGMQESFFNSRKPTKKFLSFGLTIDVHSQMIQNPTTASILLEQQITHKHGFLSFQEPEKISDALSNIWEEPHKWKKISEKLNLEENFTKIQLKNISIRRNQIVHEGDYSSSLLQRQPISEQDVTEVIDFIEKIGFSIYELVLLDSNVS